jgi:hypothetical protein
MTTPGGQIGNMFKFWKGSVTYKVQVVCSKMHSGRLKLQFDPWVANGVYNVIHTNTTELNARFTSILDLSVTHEMEFTIDYVSDKPYLFTKVAPGTTNDFRPISSADVTCNIHSGYDQAASMGIFVVSVLNELVAPNPTGGAPSAAFASVDVNVFFKCDSAMEYYQPIDNNWTTAVFTPTSSVSSSDPYSSSVVSSKTSSEGSSAFFGESVVSLRTLVKRKSLNFVTINSAAAAVNKNELVTRLLPMYPANRNAGDNRTNTFESFMAPSYLAKRGSSRWVFKLVNAASTTWGYAPTHMSVERAGSAVTLPSIDTTSVDLSAKTAAQLPALFNYGVGGLEIADLSYRPLIEWQVPYYSNTRFTLACDYKNVDSNATETLLKNASMTEVLYSKVKFNYFNANKTIMEVYVGMGDDYSLFMYLAPPVTFQ